MRELQRDVRAARDALNRRRSLDGVELAERHLVAVRREDRIALSRLEQRRARGRGWLAAAPLDEKGNVNHGRVADRSGGERRLGGRRRAVGVGSNRRRSDARRRVTGGNEYEEQNDGLHRLLLAFFATDIAATEVNLWSRRGYGRLKERWNQGELLVSFWIVRRACAAMVHGARRSSATAFRHPEAASASPRASARWALIATRTAISLRRPTSSAARSPSSARSAARPASQRSRSATAAIASARDNSALASTSRSSWIASSTRSSASRSPAILSARATSVAANGLSLPSPIFAAVTAISRARWRAATGLPRSSSISASR